MSVMDDTEQGFLFSPKPFMVRKEKVSLNSGALSVSDDELVLLRSKQGTEELLELRVFAAIQGFKVQRDEMTHSLVVVDAVINTD